MLIKTHSCPKCGHPIVLGCPKCGYKPRILKKLDAEAKRIEKKLLEEKTQK